MKKLEICITCFFLTLLCIVSAFGQNASEQAGAKPMPEPTGGVISTKDSEENQYRIGFQDLLDITVFRIPELNQTVTVGTQGTIALFRLDHPVVAVCRTARELADDIAKAYSDAKYLKKPQISVMVREQKSQAFSVIGAVEKPGDYYVSHKISLLQLLAKAGGPNKESGTRLLVARSGSSSSCKDVSTPNDDDVAVMGFSIRDVQEAKQTMVMQPGDVVSVLDADIVYVYGNVNKQGALKVREPITLTQALASAEGLKANAKKDKVRVLRQMPGKADRDEMVFDLGQIDKGKVKDPYLEPNDIVAVSEDKVKTILHGITSTIKNSVPTAAYRF